MTLSSAEKPCRLTWLEANRRYLMAAVRQIHQRLKETVARKTIPSDLEPATRIAEDVPEIGIESNLLESPPVIDVLCQRFGLSLFERQILLLCAGAELNRKFGSLFAALHGDPQQAYPTFGLALSLFPEGDWAALTPTSPLRQWCFIEVMPGVELTQCPLRIDEHILHRLMGLEQLDVRLRGIVEFVAPDESTTLPISHQTIANQIVEMGLGLSHERSAVQLWGSDGPTKRAIALAAAARQGLSLHVVDAAALPTDRSQVKHLQTLWTRESIFSQSIVLLACDHLSLLVASEVAQRKTIVGDVVEHYDWPLIVASEDRFPQRQRPLLSIQVHSPTPWEQRQLWYEHLGKNLGENLGETVSALSGCVDQLVSYFNLSTSGIQSVCDRVNTTTATEAVTMQLWQTCLEQARPKLGELAQRMSSSAKWDELILPEVEFQVLRTLVAHVRQRATVYERWGFSRGGQRGLGISALFAGASGTGKTLAAETLANELNLDLYRIDLSMVVSKYIGETEKNLRRIFDGAEKGGAILLFDEADALFGKRSDVKDARDRYANMEVAYLLQRIEAYRGLAILTTNLKDSLDQAFLRRIRFVVQFPFPDAMQREKIWRCSFPAQVPLGDLKFKTLAKLNLAGGNIRNIVLNAAFLAAAEGSKAVEMGHVLKAAQSEYIKLERPLTELRDRDIQKWIA